MSLFKSIPIVLPAKNLRATRKYFSLARILLSLLLWVFATNQLVAQYSHTGFYDLPDTSFTDIKRIEKEFAIWEEQKEDDGEEITFKELRGFKKTKEVQLIKAVQNAEEVERRINVARDTRDDINLYLEDAEFELGIIEQGIADLKASRRVSYRLQYAYDAFDEDGNVTNKDSLILQLSADATAQEEEIHRLKEKRHAIDLCIGSLERADGMVDENNLNIEDDLRRCDFAIDEAISPERAHENFKETMSAVFAGLITILIVAFFGIIYAKPEAKITLKLLSAGGLQFITVFVLIIAIVLFGVLGILEGRELAAILSGIAGYILGKTGTGRTSKRATEAETIKDDKPKEEPPLLPVVIGPTQPQ